MTLQNRVTPSGDIIADEARGLWMGNRGGRLHNERRELGLSRWKSKAWIICKLSFKGWHRVVMSPGTYTELFFLDEATALAAGHRPCFECRRPDAERFMMLWRSLDPARTQALVGDVDSALHQERVGIKRAKKTVQMEIGALPEGAMIGSAERAWLKLGSKLLGWTPSGYDCVIDAGADRPVRVLTPPTTLTILAAGYRPSIHPSAGRFVSRHATALTIAGQAS